MTRAKGKGGWPRREVEAHLTLEFTEKQLEALAWADELGWFEVPREANSDDLSVAMKVSNDTALYRIRKAERELLDELTDAVGEVLAEKIEQ